MSICTKPLFGTIYIENNLEEYIDMKDQSRIKGLKNPISIREAASKTSKIFVDNIFKNDIDFNDVVLENLKLVGVNFQPAVNEHLTPKNIWWYWHKWDTFS